MNIDRRALLRSAMFGIVAPAFLQRLSFAAAMPTAVRPKKTLVVIMLRGAVDGLSVVAPYADPRYYSVRPSIALPRPTDSSVAADARLIDLDGQFGLHPALAGIAPYFADKRLAFVHASGSPSNSRSHFDAQDFMESGTPDRKGTDDGFLNRLVQSTYAKADANDFRALAIASAMPRIMSGNARVLAFSRLQDLKLGRGKAGASAEQSLEAMYAQAVRDALHNPTQQAFDVAHRLENAHVDQAQPENGAEYPGDPFGRSMRELAALIKADLGVQVAFTDIGGWDTHTAQGASQGQLAGRLKVFGDTLRAFSVDLGTRMDDIVVVAMSEFGRTVRENGSRGTDHGHGNVMMLMHGGVHGGRIYGKWPGLGDEHLYEGRDLAITTDFRSVLWQAASKHLGAASLATVFPGYTPGAEHLGFIG